MKMEELLNETKSSYEIKKIIPKEKDRYDVYFSFLDIPVTVNKTYLENVIKYSNKEILFNHK